MIERLLVNANGLDAFLTQPLARFAAQAWRVAEILRAVSPITIPARMDDYNVALLNLRRGVLEILGRDESPLVLRNVDDHSRAVVKIERKFVSERQSLNHMRGRIRMRGAMHDGKIG